MPSRTIVSFGFKHGTPDLGPDGLLVDVRREPGIPNPWGALDLRDKTGRDPMVQRFLLGAPGFSAAMDRIRNRVKDWPGPIYVGCHGGRHRSVFVAELIGVYLSAQGVDVTVNHRDL